MLMVVPVGDRMAKFASLNVEGITVVLIVFGMWFETDSRHSRQHDVLLLVSKVSYYAFDLTCRKYLLSHGGSMIDIITWINVRH
jgi:hypothetical protein